jgi:hypothetical protein
MPADKELRLMKSQLFAGFGIVFGGIAANMPHQHFYVFAGKNQLFGKFTPDVTPVNVTIYSTQRLIIFLKRASQFDRAKITGMPYLVAGSGVITY